MYFEFKNLINNIFFKRWLLFNLIFFLLQFIFLFFLYDFGFWVFNWLTNLQRIFIIQITLIFIVYWGFKKNLGPSKISLKDLIKKNSFIVFGFLFAGLFDHYTYSQTQAVIVFIFGLFYTNKEYFKIPSFLKAKYLNSEFVINIFLYYNFIVALAQVFFVQNLPLAKTLSLNTPGVSKIEFFNLVFIRAYGLFNHPNILGFFAFIILVINIKKHTKNSFLNNLNIFTSLLLIIFTFSRSAIILGILPLVFYFLKNLSFKKITFGSLFLIVIFINRILTSDIFRLNDISVFYQNLFNLNIWQILFGIGPGQYPYMLMSNYPDFQSWQYQPVHNFLFNLVIESGLVYWILNVLFLIKIIPKIFEKLDILKPLSKFISLKK